MWSNQFARSRALIAPALCDLDDEARRIDARDSVERAYQLPRTKADRRERTRIANLRALRAFVRAQKEAA